MLHFRNALSCLLLPALALSATELPARKAGESPLGMAWRVRGVWQVDGESAPILAGDAIRPGSLLEPGKGDTNDSITILLPDGQRITYECFTAWQCNRGFRVPQLYGRPDAFAVDMLARVRAVLVKEPQPPPAVARSAAHSFVQTPLEEAVVALVPNRPVCIAGLAASMSNGRYTADLRALHAAHPLRLRFDFDKSGPFIALPIPAPGLYDILILDSLHRPRIDLFVAAVPPARAASLVSSFHHAQALLAQWTTYDMAWPVGIIERAYLESLVLGIHPQTARALPAAETLTSQNVTAEPLFSPKPGIYSGKLAVTLRCTTPAAVLHYTIDGSQPIATSPVYTAPVIVEGGPMTIKAFAVAPHKKDSAIVTGIYHMND